MAFFFEIPIWDLRETWLFVRVEPAFDFWTSDLARSCKFCEHGFVDEEQEDLILNFVVGGLDAFERRKAIALLRSEPAARSLFLNAAEHVDLNVDELEAADVEFINRILDVPSPNTIVSKTNFLGQQYSRLQIFEFFVGAIVGLLLIVILLFVFIWAG